MLRRRLLMQSGEGIDPVTGRGFVNGYEVVDLGLSNGLLFATCNVGANVETDCGDYYMYGNGSRKYNSSDSYHQGMENPLASSADTGTQVMGSEWRMPTKAELEDLFNKTNYTWVTINGMNGGKFISKTNPNAYVFFPASGNYYHNKLHNKGSYGCVWSSTPYNSRDAYILECRSGGKIVNGPSCYRYYGFPVRGVHEAV